MGKVFMFFGFMVLIFYSNAQVNGSAYIHVTHPNKKVIPYPPVREADVMWSKTVWRVMDLRQKMNHPFYYPHVPHDELRSLMGVILKNIDAGELTVYSTMNDEFTIPMTRSEALGTGITTETFSIQQPDGTDRDTTIKNEFPIHQVTHIRIKEVWFFNRKTAQMNVQIIGICPVKESYTNDGVFKGYLPMFWVYYPELRFHLINQKTFLRSNSAPPLTYDDLFQKRFFSSYVYKQSNVYNRSNQDFLSGNDVLLESKKIETNIFNFEQDLWEY